MKSVLISVQPKWVEKIASGEKTIEVRKTRPKLETPFKSYIYCTTKGYEKVFYVDKFMHKAFLNVKGRGKVIGEFVCDSIEMVNAKCSDYGIDLFYHDCMAQGCLTEREIEKYFNIPEDKDLRVMKGNGYAWHISDLKIYDKPKELSEFSTYAYNSEYTVKDGSKYSRVIVNPLKRPPQSWCYVEV